SISALVCISFNASPTPYTYNISLHDALPIYDFGRVPEVVGRRHLRMQRRLLGLQRLDPPGQGFELSLLAIVELPLPSRPGAGVGRRRRERRACLAHRLRRGRRALSQPVLVATDVLAPGSVAFGRDRLRHDIVEERAIVTDEQQRALVLLQGRLEQL